MTTNPRRGRLLFIALLLACGGGGGGGNDETSTAGDATTGEVPATTMTTSAGPTTTSATTTATVTTVGPSDTGTSEFPCCAARSEAGCSDDPEIAACVCEIDRFCCESVWDEVCAEKVTDFGCGVCEPGPTTVTTTTSSDVTTGDPPDNVGACCSPHPETGCELPSISECVCNTEPSCCELEWDAFCVETVGTNGCGVCPPIDPTDTDTGPPPDNTESCCAAHESTGCEYEAIAECVCAELPQCCSDAWSDSCIDAVGELGCGVCPG